MREKLYLFIVLFSANLFCQNIIYEDISKEISKLNRSGRYVESQKRLSLLIEKNPTDTEKSHLILLLAQTYRSINDYNTALKYLKEASANSEHSSEKVKSEIQAEFAFVYFDNHQYEESEKIMRKIALENYKSLTTIDKAYLIMQQGYVSFLKKNYVDSEKKYKQSIALMRKSNSCDLPVVHGKQIELLGKIGKLYEAEKIYEESMKIAESCKIIKYQMYVTDEYKKVLIRLKNPKAILYIQKYDSLNARFDRDHKLSLMYIENIEQEQKSKKTLQNNDFIKSIIYGLSLILFLIIIYIITKKNKKTNLEKQKIEEELVKMKEQLSKYLQVEHFSSREQKNFYHEKLTERQIELISYLEKGYSNKEIADKMFITEATVKYHIKNIYEILELKNRKEFFAKKIKI
jgi:DNA-binding CsgD family transcriptional regulator/predicted transposase YbfD/YdcC